MADAVNMIFLNPKAHGVADKIQAGQMSFSSL